MTSKYLYLMFVVLIFSCKRNEIEKRPYKEVKISEEVLKEIFKHQEDITSQGLVTIDLHKIESNDLVEEIGEIIYYQDWTFDKEKNEYIPKGVVKYEVNNLSSKTLYLPEIG